MQNRQVARTADLFLQVESSEGFVLAGARQARLPTLLAGTSEDIFYNAIPLMCGRIRLPTFKIVDKRRTGVVRHDAVRDADAVADESAVPVQVVLQGEEFRGSSEDEDGAHYLLVHPA